LGIGKRVKQLRLRAGLTQEELANRADLSKGFISQLENDGTSPSIATLEDIVRALGTNLATFFQESPEDRRQVVFGRDARVVSGESAAGFELVFPIPEAHRNDMEPVLVTLEPGGRTACASAHEGEELGFVLSGEIDLRLGDASHRVRKEEFFYFAADTDHQILNTGTRRARVLWVSCPPSF